MPNRSVSRLARIYNDVAYLVLSKKERMGQIMEDKRGSGLRRHVGNRARVTVLDIGLMVFVLCWLSMPMPIQAQSNQGDGGTIPNGTIPGNVKLYLPLIAQQNPVTTPAPTPTPPTFVAIPVDGPPTDRPAVEHPDLNLAIRSYNVTTGTLGLVDINGPTDIHAPQFDGLFQPSRLPTMTALYQVYDWDWGCACQGGALATPPATLLAVATTPGEALHIPTRDPQIYGGGFKAMVLYAAANRITLAYTRNDTAAIGYIVHLEEIAVAPELLALYVEKDGAGRVELPALRNGEPFATALGTSIKIAIRDTGTFMEPRSRKDWWKAY